VQKLKGHKRLQGVFFLHKIKLPQRNSSGYRKECHQQDQARHRSPCKARQPLSNRMNLHGNERERGGRTVLEECVHGVQAGIRRSFHKQAGIDTRSICNAAGCALEHHAELPRRTGQAAGCPKRWVVRGVGARHTHCTHIRRYLLAVGAWLAGNTRCVQRPLVRARRAGNAATPIATNTDVGAKEAVTAHLAAGRASVATEQMGHGRRLEGIFHTKLWKNHSVLRVAPLNKQATTKPEEMWAHRMRISLHNTPNKTK
jgi:hypothetical protein